MSKTYLPYEPDQQLLLPAALQEWLPDDHLAYFISDVVDQLDMSEVTARYERERRGGPPYHPRMMVKVLLYGYCVGVASSRRIAQRLHEDIAFRVLAANNTPDFRTISDFRKDNLDALSGLFVQVLALCQQAGLVKLGKYPLMLAITRRRQSTGFMLWAWTRSSRRSRPATAGLCHPRPEVAYPAICLPGTGCDGSYRPGGVGSATLCGCKLWSRYSARSSRAGDSGSSCCGDWRR